MALFGKKSVLGIDIGTSSLKVIELGPESGRFKLKNYGFMQLEEFTNKPGHNVSEKDTIAGLKELFKKIKFSSKDVVASIPSFSTFTTVLELPYLSEKDLARVIPYEARRYIPIPIEDVVLDWSIISVKKTPGSPEAAPQSSSPREYSGQAGQAKPPNVEIFLAAVPKDEAEKYRRIFSSAGLRLKALELENIALIRSLIGNDLSPAAVVNIGGGSTSIFVVEKGFERISHNYEIGGFGITRAIARSFGVSLERAENLKKTKGLTKDNIDGQVTSLIDTIIFETKKVISNYQNKKGVRVERILLTGGLNNMPGFMEYLKKRIEITVLQSNPFARVIFPDKLKPILGNLSNVFATAIGLAMREI